MIDFSTFDLESIFFVVESTHNLKRNQTRPLRAEIIELAIEKYSNSQLKYIGDKENGRDFASNTDPVMYYECKSMHGLFQPRANYTKPIILANFHGATVTELTQTFDYMILIDTKIHSIGVCDWDSCTENLSYSDAYVSTRIHHDQIRMIGEEIAPKNAPIDMESRLMNLIREII